MLEICIDLSGLLYLCIKMVIIWQLTQRTLSFFGKALNNTSEQSEVSPFCAVLRSCTSVQDDKFVNNVNIGSTSILLLIFNVAGL